MSVTVRIPSLVRQFTNKQEVVEVTAYNVLECLNNLTAQFPDLRRWLYDKQGELRPQVHIFINGERASAGELLKDGDELLIMLAIGGG